MLINLIIFILIIKIIYLFHININEQCQYLRCRHFAARMLFQGCVLTNSLTEVGSNGTKESRWGWEIVAAILTEGRAMPWRSHTAQPEVGGAASKQETSIRVRDKGHDKCRWIAKNKEAFSRRGKRTRSRPASKSPREEATVEKLSRCMLSATRKIISARELSKSSVTLRKSDAWNQILLISYVVLMFGLSKNKLIKFHHLHIAINND